MSDDGRIYIEGLSDEAMEKEGLELLRKVGVRPPGGMTATECFLRACRAVGIGRSPALQLPGTIDPFALDERKDELIAKLREDCLPVER